MPLGSPFELVRPLAWIAAIAFFLGFGGYLALAAADAARAARLEAAAPLQPALVDGDFAARL